MIGYILINNEVKNAILTISTIWAQTQKKPIDVKGTTRVTLCHQSIQQQGDKYEQLPKSIKDAGKAQIANHFP